MTGEKYRKLMKAEMMPATSVLVVSDDSVADVCEVPVPADELRVDEGAVGDSVAVELSVDVVTPVDVTSELAEPLGPVEPDVVSPVPNVG